MVAAAVKVVAAVERAAKVAGSCRSASRRSCLGYTYS